MRPYRSLAAGAARAGRVPALVLATLVLTLLSGLPACSGASEDGAPLGAAETSAPTAGSMEPPTPATSEPAPETLQPPGTPPDPPLSGPPADPDEPDAPAASPPPDDPTAPASEEAPTPVAEPPPLLYDIYDLSGAVSEPGHYAFLADPDDPTSVVTTYEGLRDGTATALLIHTHDAHGISRTDLYDAVESGDLFEWRQAADCFVRYQVTAVKPDSTGTAPQKLLGVAWMTYAFTGCSGTVATTTAATLDWSDLPALGGPSLPAPIRHGLWQIVPEGWTGATEASQFIGDQFATPVYVETIAEARLFPRWREPDLPSEWVFWYAMTDPDVTPRGYEAAWGTGPGWALIIEGEQVNTIAYPNFATGRGSGTLAVAETRIIAGRPAMVFYSPAGALNAPYYGTVLFVHDPETNSVYTLHGRAKTLRGSNIDALIAIAESLFAEGSTP